MTPDERLAKALERIATAFEEMGKAARKAIPILEHLAEGLEKAKAVEDDLRRRKRP